MRRLFAFAIMVFACAAGHAQPLTLPLPPARSTHLGFSLVPLNEQGWLVLADRPEQFALRKAGAEPDEGYAVQGSTTSLPAFASPEAFLAEVVKRGTADSVAGRFKLVAHSAQLAPATGDMCARTHTVTEDHAPVRRSSRSGPMILEIYAITCAHPGNRAIGVMVGYSERYYPGHRDPRLEKSADTLLGSVTLNDL